MKISYCQYNPDTIESVRKECNLHTPGAMERAIDVLSNWIHKQEHFVKKDLPREYMERFIISAKGSVEIAKTRIDKLYTMQTLAPQFFRKCHAKNDFPNLRNFFILFFVPELSEDNCRIQIAKLMSKDTTPAACLEAYQHFRILAEYTKMHDYANGYKLIYDLTDVNITDVIRKVDWIEFRNGLNLAIDAYGYRLAGIYIISASKMINALMTIVKPMLSEKLAKRIHVLKNKESLHVFFPIKLLPEDFGGELKSSFELYDEMNEALCSEEHLKHMEEMRQARTNEELRRTDSSLRHEYLGMPGSFKMLSVD